MCPPAVPAQMKSTLSWVQSLLCMVGVSNRSLLSTGPSCWGALLVFQHSFTDQDFLALVVTTKQEFSWLPELRSSLESSAASSKR